MRTTCDIVGSQCRRFNDTVRGELRRRKQKQKDLAEYIGLSSGEISRKLTGEHEWGFKDVLKTCEFLEISIGDII